MAERRGSWPWRKKASPKADKASFLLPPSQPASLVTSFVNDTPSTPPIAPNGRQEPLVPATTEGAHISEAVRRREEAEENVKVLKEELSTALKEVTEKEAVVKRHEKVAEEAVLGWEKSEKEALSYKQELEAATKQKTILEDRVAHLDGALKECMKQVRHVKEEQDRKIDETITCKTREWEKIKEEVDAKQAELERRLMESEAQNSAMAKSLQERARKIIEANEAKEKAETEVKVLQVKLGSSEKEISALKYELHVLSKELEIRNEEVECNKKAADVAHKQHLDNVKKVAKLEADCQRLRNLVRKKLPGPAAIAQMRREVDGPFSRESVAGDMKRRPIKSLTSSISLSSSYQSDISANSRDVEMLKDRMSSMEEETRLLKEALSKRNEELHASRLLCAKTVNKLSMAEDHLESLQGTPTEMKMNGVDHNVNNESSNTSVPDEQADASNVEESSCAESWASALISELALFKKGNPTVQGSGKESAVSHKSFDTSTSLEATPVADGVLNQAKNLSHEAMKGSTEVGEAFSKVKELHMLCKELDCKFGVLEDQVRELKPENGEAAAEQVKESISSSIDAAHQKFVELEKAVQGMGNPVQSCNTPNCPVDPATLEEETPPGNSILVSSLRLVLCKLIMLLEILLPLSRQEADAASTHLDSKVDTMPTMDPTCQSELEAEKPEGALSTSWDQQKQDLMSSKDSFLEGKSSISEFLIRFALVLFEAFGSKSAELEELLVMVNAAEIPRSFVVDVDASGFLNELSLARDQLQQVMDANAELGTQMALISQELEGTKVELGKSEELVTDLKNKVVELQNLKEELSNVEAIKAELQGKLESAEGEVNKLQSSVVTLTLELDEQKKLCEEAGVKCEELENQLQGRLIYEDDCNPLKVVPDDEDTRLSKERELETAKEKLAECQRTILALGKQLSAISSPPVELSPGGSFDTVSMDSMMELQNGGSMDHHHYNNNQNHHYQNHHGDGRYNSTMPAAAQYNTSHSGRRVGLHTTTPPLHSIHSTASMHATGHTPPSSQSSWSASRGRRVYEDLQETPRSWSHSNGSFTKGARHAGPLPETDHPHPHHYGHQARRPAYVSPSCQRNCDASGSHLAWPPTYVAEEEERQLALTVYSPPHTALSSPSRSPARYTRQHNGGRAAGRTTARTSLTESMNTAAATTSSADNGHSQASKPSTFGKLFSRSRNHR